MYRIIDANINRVSEGLRVLEDYARFNKNNKSLSSEIRTLRHGVRKTFDETLLITSRDTTRDVGIQTTKENCLDKKTSLDALLKANIKRVQEGLRVIEENLKLLGYDKQSKTYESFRYQSYTIEQKLINKAYPKDETIYLILGEDFSAGRSNYEVAEQALKSGVKIIQYREKNKSKQVKLEECRMLKVLIDSYDGFFIVNDDIDIAILIQADGIHLGQDDMHILEARKLVGNMCIGVSTHTIEEARQAVLDQADYIGVGPMFKTNTKKDVVTSKGIEFLEEVSKEIDLPYVAIGGIKLSRIQSIKPYMNQIAMISEICGSEDINETINQIKGEI